MRRMALRPMTLAALLALALAACAGTKPATAPKPATVPTSAAATVSGAEASEHVPVAAGSVTISALLGSRGRAKAGPPVTVRDQGEVARIATLINRLPAFRGPACIPVPTNGIRLTFRDASGQLLGAVVVPVASCTVQLSRPGKGESLLADNPAVVPGLLRVAGIHWFGY